jgi:hypothetical protein
MLKELLKFEDKLVRPTYGNYDVKNIYATQNPS